MSQENVEIIRRGYALFAAGDFEAVAALLSDDVEVTDAGGLGVTAQPRAPATGPRDFYGPRRRRWRRLRTSTLSPRTS